MFAYAMVDCWACEWPLDLREFDLVFDVPGTPDTILLKDVKHHVKTVLMGHYDALIGVWPLGLREFDLVFNVPGMPDTILLEYVKRHVKTVLMGHFDLATLIDTEHGNLCHAVLVSLEKRFHQRIKTLEKNIGCPDSKVIFCLYMIQ